MTDERPKSPIIGADGNIFNLMSIASRTLKQHGFEDEAKEMNIRISTEAKDYDDALNIISEYVEPVSENELEDEYEL